MTNLPFLFSVTLLAAFLDLAESRSKGGGGAIVYYDDGDEDGASIGVIVFGISIGFCVLGCLFKACEAADGNNSRPAAPIRRVPAPTRSAPTRTAPAPNGSPKVRQLDLSNLPFCFVPGEFPGSPYRAVCEPHHLECCKLGCHSDYTLMNKLSASPGYQVLKQDHEKLNFARTFVTDYFRSLSREPMPGGCHFPIPVDKVILQWEAIADTADPVKLVNTFAGICYVKRCLPLSVKLTNAATQNLQLLRVLTLVMQAQAPPPPHFPSGVPPAPRTAPPTLAAPPHVPDANAAPETDTEKKDDDEAWKAVDEEFHEEFHA